MKIKKSHLKELIRQSIKELDFKDKEAFHKYDKKHKMRASTKVKIGGKETTVGQAIDVGGPSHADVPKKKSAKDMDWYGGGDFTKSADYDMWSDDEDDEEAAKAQAEAAYRSALANEQQAYQQQRSNAQKSINQGMRMLSGACTLGINC